MAKPDVASLGVQRSALNVERCLAAGSERFRLVVISPEAEDAREHAVLAQLFAAGLTSYHLRKPTWTREQLAAWLEALPTKFHARIVLHTYHELAGEFAVGGVHEREAVGPALAPRLSDVDARMRRGASAGPTFRSRAVHDVATLRASLDAYERLLVSPVFPSISKVGYAPDARLTHDELRAALALPRRAEAIALGGIDATRIAVCRDLGFDGVAVLGAVWQANEPLQTFTELQTIVNRGGHGEHGANPSSVSVFSANSVVN